MAGTFTNLIYHVVFSTKYRKPLILGSFKERLYEYIGGIIRGKGGTLFTIGGTLDHVHLAVRLKPAESVSKAIGDLKGLSSKWVNDEKLLAERFSWQIGFSAFSVSESQLHAVMKYIETQQEHHQRNSFKVEFVAMLKHYNVSYDPASIWD